MEKPAKTKLDCYVNDRDPIIVNGKKKKKKGHQSCQIFTLNFTDFYFLTVFLYW